LFENSDSGLTKSESKRLYGDVFPPGFTPRKLRLGPCIKSQNHRNDMKTTRFAALLLSAAFAGAAFVSRADDLEDLAGKWSVSKSKDGAQFKQVIEIKKDKFVFHIINGDQKEILYAEGKVKLDKASGLKIIKFVEIQYGQSKEDLQTLDDDRTDIYTLRDGKLLLVSNFDKERDDQEPQVDAYIKSTEATADKAKDK
jgi:uncharacterized protein (TIGR03067 family)